MASFSSGSFSTNSFSVVSFLIDVNTTPTVQIGGGGFFDYGENKRIHEAQVLLAEVTQDNVEVKLPKAVDVVDRLKEEVARLEVKAAQFQRENRIAEMIRAQLAQEQMEAQIEEIDTVFVMFMMLAQVD